MKEKQIQTHIVQMSATARAVGGHSYLPTTAPVILDMTFYSAQFAQVFQPVFAAGKYTQSAGYLEEKSLFIDCQKQKSKYNQKLKCFYLPSSCPKPV